jgi:branched-chain amino acid transport system permease protein
MTKEPIAHRPPGIAWLRSRWAWPAYGLLLLALPLLLSGEYPRHLLVLSLMFALLATGLNLTMGYVGYLPFGYLIFFAIGAYTSTLLAIHAGVSFWLGVPAAGLVSAVFAVGIGAPSLRLRGPYFAITTLAFAEIGVLVLNNWTEVTHGPMGIPGVPRPILPLTDGSFIFDNGLSWYYLMLGILAITLVLVHRLIHSRIGDALIAIRENEDLAEAIGIPSFRYKLLGFTLSAAIAGCAGSAYAHYFTIVSPELAGFYFIITTFTMVIIGGQGTLAGPVLGAIVFTLLPELLRAAKLWRMVFFGALMLAGIVFLPRGLKGLWDDLMARQRKGSAP